MIDSLILVTFGFQLAVVGVAAGTRLVEPVGVVAAGVVWAGELVVEVVVVVVDTAAVVVGEVVAIVVEKVVVVVVGSSGIEVVASHRIAPAELAEEVVHRSLVADAVAAAGDVHVEERDP